MSLFDRIFGSRTPEPDAAPPPRAPRGDDERAVERYRYLLETAPPEAIERVHAEAFAKLTPEQRRMVFDRLSESAPEGEAPRDDQPATLAQAATRSELRQPGTMERSFAGPSFGSMMGASLLGTVAGYVVASALVSAFLPPMEGGGAEADGGGDGDAGEAGAGDAVSGDAGMDGGDGGGFFDAGGFDDGGGFGDFGF
ncbi:hypothetical protein GCM10009792_05130 [Microcella alkalica]|uniref:DUF2076 domain-containing protein n=1 Tax=Microcella alkalica TaxID=355930 RepID=A0A839E5L5_9MICO|nr:hypothetical protein [Microcella alkalica]MBA8846636.1 hypothetical protein [Microcella alkalica]